MKQGLPENRNQVIRQTRNRKSCNSNITGKIKVTVYRSTETKQQRKQMSEQQSKTVNRTVNATTNEHEQNRTNQNSRWPRMCFMTMVNNRTKSTTPVTNRNQQQHTTNQNHKSNQ
jgi:hypothetical protein